VFPLSHFSSAHSYGKKRVCLQDTWRLAQMPSGVTLDMVSVKCPLTSPQESPASHPSPPLLPPQPSPSLASLSSHEDPKAAPEQMPPSGDPPWPANPGVPSSYKIIAGRPSPTLPEASPGEPSLTGAELPFYIASMQRATQYAKVPVYRTESLEASLQHDLLQKYPMTRIRLQLHPDLHVETSFPTQQQGKPLASDRWIWTLVHTWFHASSIDV
jgi:hypothetical protein